MVNELEKLTVVELKSILKERGLTTSGTKKVLIQRLESADSKKPEVKVEFECIHCSSRLRIPKSYNGKIKCPSCSNEQEISGSKLKEELSMDLIINKIKNLDQQQISLAISLIGIIFAFFAIIIFFSAFSYDAMCTEEDQGTITIDGEEFDSCDSSGVIWETGTAKRIFNACCILVPISSLLTVSGFLMRKESKVKNVPEVTMLKPDNLGRYSIEDSKNQNHDDSNMSKIIQIGGMGIGVSLGVITIVLGILLLVFIIFVFSIILGAWEASPPFQP